MVRAWANVSMYCRTQILNKEKFTDLSKVPRENLVCKINYVAQGKQNSNLMFFNVKNNKLFAELNSIWNLNFVCLNRIPL